MPRKTVKKAKREVAQILNRAEDPNAVLTELAKDTKQEAIEATEERMPGKVVRGQKTSWTLKDVENIFPICEFTPDDTVQVTWNGVMIQFIAGCSQIMPTCFRDLYLETKRRTRASKPIMVSTGKIDIEPGAGALE